MKGLIMELNERIFHLLNQNKQTSKELSKYINIKPSSISAWKNNGSFPSSKHIVKIAEFLAVSIEFLLTGKDDSIDRLPPLDPDQEELLTLYNSLDSRGKHKLHTLMYEELDRISTPSYVENRNQNAG